jgi:hypothetical protein
MHAARSGMARGVFIGVIAKSVNGQFASNVVVPASHCHLPS